MPKQLDQFGKFCSQDGDTRSLGSWTASVNFVGLLRSSEEKKTQKIRTKPKVGKANLAKTKLAKPKAGEKKENHLVEPELWQNVSEVSVFVAVK